MRQSSIDDDCGIRQTPAIEMPCFMEQGPGFIDGWKPAEPLGDFDLDYLTGQAYAEMAVKYARQIKDHKVLGFIIATIQTKALRGQLTVGGTEQGFFDRLARMAYAGSTN